MELASFVGRSCAVYRLKISLQAPSLVNEGMANLKMPKTPCHFPM